MTGILLSRVSAVNSMSLASVSPGAGSVSLVGKKSPEDRLIERRVIAHILHQQAERGWSQNDMAEHLGIRSGTLSKYITGDRGTGLGFVLRVSKKLGINPTRLLEVPPPPEFVHLSEEKGAAPPREASPANAQPKRRGTRAGAKNSA
jgi:transcriptional regulator with XRE-family HTH domain